MAVAEAQPRAQVGTTCEDKDSEARVGRVEGLHRREPTERRLMQCLSAAKQVLARGAIVAVGPVASLARWRSLGSANGRLRFT